MSLAGTGKLREVDGLFAVAYADGFVFEGSECQNRIDWNRAILCVNACECIEDDVLSSARRGIDGFKLKIEELVKQRDELRTRLAALEELATAVEADIDAGRPLEYNVTDLRVELIRARKALGILPEQEQTTTLE